MKSLSSRDLPPLGLLVFVVGAASLGAEIAAARLMAPFFGASTIVWANVIGVVLVSLAVGILARRPVRGPPPAQGRVVPAGLDRRLCRQRDPVRRRPFPRRVGRRARQGVRRGVHRVARRGDGAGRSPVMLLGAASPYAIRLGVERVEEAGAVAGRLYALSTFGSLVGTFASALLLIPVIGTRRTFLVFGLACAVVALAGVRRRAAIAVPATIIALLALPVGTIKAAGDGVGARRGRNALPVRARGRGARRRAQARAERGPGGALALPARLLSDRRLLGRVPRAAVRRSRRGLRGRSRSWATPPARRRARSATTSHGRASMPSRSIRS